jgi:hypothetical protein
VIVLLASLTLAIPARADIKMPKIISDHMVLQRGVAVPVWGWADPGEEVIVRIAGQSKTTRADAEGKWMVRLGRIQGAGPHTLTVQGKTTVSVEDVLIGEVWLASGQSNMAMFVKNSKDFDKEGPAANFPKLRMFTVKRDPAREPKADCDGSWQLCSPETVGNFSAAAYFFGRDLYQKLQVPVGMINSSVGGTPIEAWISMDALKGRPQLKDLFATWDRKAESFDPAAAKAANDKALTEWKIAWKKAKAEGKEQKDLPRRPRLQVHPRDDQTYPATLFNGMIAPLIQYAIRGAIWYQGESNARTRETAALYRLELALLIGDWRGRWGEGDFPFAWVQLPNYAKGGKGWPFLRETMLRSLSLPNTGMIVAIDIGDPTDIHPKNKQEIGRRLALWARAQVYGEKVPWSGPLPAGQTVKGSTIELRFTHADGGLKIRGDELRGFQVAGADHQWQPAVAQIAGDRVIVSNPSVPEPVAVRYNWANNPDGNLVNGAGLPASPFRTDND